MLSVLNVFSVCMWKRIVYTIQVLIVFVLFLTSILGILFLDDYLGKYSSHPCTSNTLSVLANCCERSLCLLHYLSIAPLHTVGSWKRIKFSLNIVNCWFDRFLSFFLFPPFFKIRNKQIHWYDGWLDGFANNKRYHWNFRDKSCSIFPCSSLIIIDISLQSCVYLSIKRHFSIR